MNLSAVEGHNVLYNGQTQAGAPRLAGTAPVHPVKALKNPVQRFRRDANSGIGDGKHRLTVFTSGGDGDLSAGAVVLDAVFHQVEDDLLEPAGGEGGGALVAGDGEGDLLLLGLQIQQICRLLSGGQQGSGAALLLNRHRVQLGDFEDVIDEGDEPVHLHPNEGEKALLVLRLGDHPGGEHVGKALDGGEGGLELVGDIGGEVTADVLRPLELGDIGQEDGGAHPLPLVLLPRDGGEEEAQAAPRHGQIVHIQHHLGLLAVALFHSLPQTTAAGGEKQPGEVAGVLRHPEQLPSGPVAGQKSALLVQQEQALVHTVQDEVYLVPLAGQAVDGIPQPLHQLVDVAQDGPQLVIPPVGVQTGGL